jgi:hypothetical protein
MSMLPRASGQAPNMIQADSRHLLIYPVGCSGADQPVLGRPGSFWCSHDFRGKACFMCHVSCENHAPRVRSRRADDGPDPLEPVAGRSRTGPRSPDLVTGRPAAEQGDGAREQSPARPRSSPRGNVPHEHAT